MNRHGSRRARCGLTLVEMVTALAVLALLSLLGWRGLDSLLSAQSAMTVRHQQVSQTALTLDRLRDDLYAVTPNGAGRCLDWDGRHLRLTRRAPDGGGLQGIVWHWDGQTLQRWATASRRTPDELRPLWRELEAWPRVDGRDARAGEPGPGAAAAPSRAGGWQGDAPLPLKGLSLHYHRFQAWSPAHSAAAVPTPDNPCALPDAVRFILQLEGPALTGPVTVHWLRPGMALGGT